MWPEGGSEGYKRVQSIGPSPVVVHKNDLESIAREWKDLSEKLKVNPEADSKLGWVIEMWVSSLYLPVLTAMCLCVDCHVSLC